jgi:hypothetical protein
MSTSVADECPEARFCSCMNKVVGIVGVGQISIWCLLLSDRTSSM